MPSSRKSPGLDHLIKEWLEEKYPDFFVIHRDHVPQIRLGLDPNDMDPIVAIMPFSPKLPGTIYYRADDPKTYWDEAALLLPFDIKYFDHIEVFIKRGIENIMNPLSREGRRLRHLNLARRNY